MSSSPQSEKHPRRTQRIPEKSFFFERLVPVIFLVLGLIMAALIIIAAGVLLGLIQYR